VAAGNNVLLLMCGVEVLAENTCITGSCKQVRTAGYGQGDVPYVGKFTGLHNYILRIVLATADFNINRIAQI
jgi:hypothetical protein